MSANRKTVPKTVPFVYQGEKQFVAVEDYRETLRRRRCRTDAILDEVVCPVTGCGCAIEEIAASPTGDWLVTNRVSGQGEWGYDVFRTCPLARIAGTPEERGYTLEIPKFTPGETRLVAGVCRKYTSGWWTDDADENWDPARGGLISVGFLLVHHLPSHRVERHELRMDLPKCWRPDQPDAEMWHGAWEIIPGDDKIRLTLPGRIPFQVEGPLPAVIVLPTPQPSGGRLS